MSKVPVEDRLDIQELVARYAFFCDTAQYDKIEGLFTEDGSFDESIIGMPAANGRAALRQLFMGEGGKAKFMIHLNCNHLLHSFSGNAASGTSHLHVEAMTDDGKVLRLFGYYDDTYAKLAGEWLLRSRKLVAIAPIVFQ